MNIAGAVSGSKADAVPDAGGLYRWYVLGLLFVAATFSTIDRYMIAALAQPLKLEFGLSDSQIGFLSGLLFAVSYTLVGLPLGLLTDRARRARLLAILMGIWSLGTMASGMASSFLSMAAARMTVAGAESGAGPTTVSLISDYFPPRRRGLAIGIYFANNAIATFLAFTVGGYLAVRFGWRIAFVAAGLPGLLLAVVVFLTLKEPKRGAFDSEPQTRAKGPGIAQTFRELGASPALLCLTAASVFMVAGISATSTFMAAFFTRSHGLSVADAGVLTGIVIGGAYAIGSVGGGLASDRLSKRSPGGGCYMMAALTVLAIPLYCIAFFAPGIVQVVALMVIAKLLLSGFYAVTMVASVTEARVTVRAAVSSLIMILMNLGGFGLGPQVAGVASDMLAASGVAHPLNWSLTGTSVGFYSLSAVFYFLAGRWIAQRARPMN